ncbi:MAG: hypothetical protein ACRDKV_08280 [Solirubrobacterales bacterium]
MVSSISAALALAALGSAGAQARVVTVGSPLTGPFTQQNFSGAITLFNLTLADPKAHEASPVTGVIVRWRLLGPVGGPFRLRVLTPAGGKSYTGAGTSAPRMPTAAAQTQVFATSLPIAAGQTIAIDSNSSQDHLGGRSVSGSSYGFFAPPLADGATGAAFAPGPLEVGFNADVATNTLGKPKRNRRNGTAILPVRVPGPGKLTLSGKSVRRQRPARAAAASKLATAAGRVKLRIKPKGRARRKLNRTGRARVKVKVRYTPTGGLPGVSNVQTRKVKLLKAG